MGPCTEGGKRSDIEMSELLKIQVCVEINDAQRTAKIYRDCALMQKSFFWVILPICIFFFFFKDYIISFKEYYLGKTKLRPTISGLSSRWWWWLDNDGEFLLFSHIPTNSVGC